MNKELKSGLPTKGGITRKEVLLVLVLGLSSCLYPLLLIQPDHPELVCVNWRAILEQISVFARLVFFVICGYLHIFYRKYGALRICLYLTFISFVSYFIVAHILDHAALLLWEMFRSNVIRRLEDSIIIIEENRYLSSWTADESYLIVERFRYEYEDVRFNCYYNISFESEVELEERQIIWIYKGKVIVPSWKFHIDVNYPTYGKNTYIIQSTLTIYLIEEADFGNYSCYIKKFAIPEKTNILHPKNGTPEYTTMAHQFVIDFQYHNPYQLTIEFKLTKLKQTLLITSAPPGGIISISASYLNYAEKEDISAEYLINNKDFHEACSGQQNKCSLFVLLYWLMWHSKGHLYGIPNLFLEWLHNDSSILGTSWQCACPSLYGIHVFRFYRHFYNITSGQSMVFEANHPRTVKLIPRGADLLLAFENESKPEALGADCLDSVPIISSCSLLEYVIYELNRNYFLIEHILFWIFVLASACISYGSCRLLDRWLVACRNIILEAPLWPYLSGKKATETLGGIEHSDLPFTHDVYISHADSQSDMASELASTLESFGKKVYFRDRDVVIGDVKTESVSNAIVSSRMFLIIVSQDYIESGFQNDFEFQLVLCQIHKGIISQANVMLLKHGDCSIPSYFSNFTRMQIVNLKRACTEELTRKLRLWSNCQKDED